jgi:hypothetical protein
LTTKTITNNVNQHSASTQSQATNGASATNVNADSVSTANIGNQSCVNNVNINANQQSGPSLSSLVVSCMDQQATQSGSVGPW